MSRTVRCKGMAIKESWLMSREEFEERSQRGWRWRNRQKETFEEFRKMELSLTKTDSHHRYFHWTCDAPSWFVNLYFNRPERRQAKRDIQKAISRSECFDDCDVVLEVPRQMRGAAWLYW